MAFEYFTSYLRKLLTNVTPRSLKLFKEHDVDGFGDMLSIVICIKLVVSWQAITKNSHGTHT